MRLLIVDDEPQMHDSYRRSFAPAVDAAASALSSMASELFGDEGGDASPCGELPTFECSHHLQG